MTEIKTELSERETEILKLVATGLSNKEIASQLFISPNTVKVHLRNVFSKISVVSRTEAALYAVRAGMVSVAPSILIEDETSTSEEGRPTPTSFSENTITSIRNITNPTTIMDAPNQEVRNPVLKRYRVIIAIIVVSVLASIVGSINILGSSYYSGINTAFVTPPSSPQPSISVWQDYPPLAQARSNLGVVIFARRIYAIGGETANGLTGETTRFDPAQQIWENLNDKPLPVVDSQAAVIGGLIYVPGGRSENGITNVLEVYDPNTDTWSQRAPLPAPRSAFGLVAFDGELLLIGGWDGEQYVADILAYDPQQNRWQVRGKLPTPRGYIGATIAGGEIYVVGGINEQNTYTDTIALTSGNVFQWEMRATLPLPLYDTTLVNIGDVIYAVGGENSFDSAVLSSNILWQYLPQQNQWLQIENITLPIHAGVAANEGGILVIGGQKEGVFLSDTRSYRALYSIYVPFINK